VLGVVAELERSLIAERVGAGIRNARAKGKRIGRPKVTVDASRIAALRAQGQSWSAACRETVLGQGSGAARLQNNCLRSETVSLLPDRERCPLKRPLTPPGAEAAFLYHDLHSQPAGIYGRCGRQYDCFSGLSTLGAP
jgi:hypothetical protein